MIKNLIDEIGINHVSENLPFTNEDITNLLELLNFDMESFREDVLSSQKEITDTGESKPSEKWIDITIRVHSTALDVINTEFVRIEGLIKNLDKLVIEKRRGIILAVICGLSGKTPSESLE